MKRFPERPLARFFTRARIGVDALHEELVATDRVYSPYFMLLPADGFMNTVRVSGTSDEDIAACAKKAEQIRVKIGEAVRMGNEAGDFGVYRAALRVNLARL